MLVGTAAAKGAPGVTTTALALGLASGGSIVIEADPDGGSLAPRAGLRFDPGATSLSAAARHELSLEVLAEHLQSLGARLGALVAPSDPRAARHALGTLGERLPTVLRSAPDVHGFFDLGRFDADSPARLVARALDVLVLLAPPSLEGIDALAVRLGTLEELRERCVLVTVGDGPYRPEECATALSLPLGGHLPRDDVAATTLWRDLTLDGIRRRPLGRAIADLAGALGVAPTAAKAPVAGPSDGGPEELEALEASAALATKTTLAARVNGAAQ